jgi:Soluble lytic murein transglycosylase and related regulatory proteins (some contain LysM/invasin domains)
MFYFFNHINTSKKLLLALAVLVCYTASAQRSEADTIYYKQKPEFKDLILENNVIAGRKFTTPINPQAWSFTQDYIRKQGKELERMKIWGKPYFDLYDNVLAKFGIPKELKYLSVIESHLQSNLVSWAGAVGPWQIMDYEARRFGYRTDKYRDDRMDYTKSTIIAAQLLRGLYNQFGDWLLVVAAYNGGAGRVAQAIAKSGSRDFWALQYLLKEETRNHVKKYIATHYVFENGGGLTTMTAAETKAFLASQVKSPIQLSATDTANTVVTPVNARFNSVIICNNLLMNIGDFNKWNPGFDKTLSEGKPYSMRLSKEQTEMFRAKKNDILMQSINALLNKRTGSK